jgi:nicotinamidase-related amidase
MAHSVFPKSRTALLLVDVINLFDFSGGMAFAQRALRPARHIERLRARAHRAGVPVVYVNDNWGRWRSDFKSIVDDCSRAGRPGASIARRLTPTPGDFFVLKPHLSGFHETPLDTLLRLGEVQTLIITGFAADNCVLFTAAEAHMRDYRVLVPSDCCASEDDRERHHVLSKMRKFLDADTSASRHLRLRRR